MTHILDSALLGLMEQAGIAVATLIEGLEREELLRSRLRGLHDGRRPE